MAPICARLPPSQYPQYVQIAGKINIVQAPVRELRSSQVALIRVLVQKCRIAPELACGRVQAPANAMAGHPKRQHGLAHISTYILSLQTFTLKRSTAPIQTKNALKNRHPRPLVALPATAFIEAIPQLSDLSQGGYRKLLSRRGIDGIISYKKAQNFIYMR